ncbi:MAG: pseudouridine synthase, partial [Proteobacteria bacterium]|nr:pseudouridine synthase [Pseudomonadota bacterium]
LIEGRRRQVRRMCSAVGHPVMKLKRIAYGPLSLGRLASGGIRSLGPGEVRALEKSAGLEDGKPIEE